MSNVLSQNNLQDALSKKGWTLKTLAAKYDEKYPSEDGKTVYNTLRNWNSKDPNPTLKIFIRICDLLDCDMEYLVGRQKEQRKGIGKAAELTGLSNEAAEYLVILNCRGMLDKSYLTLKTLSALITQTKEQENKDNDRAVLPYLTYFLQTDYFHEKRDKTKKKTKDIPDNESQDYDRDWGSLLRELSRFTDEYRRNLWHTD